MNINSYIICIMICSIHGLDIFRNDISSKNRNTKYVYSKSNFQPRKPKQQIKRNFHPKG